MKTNTALFICWLKKNAEALTTLCILKDKGNQMIRNEKRL
jgi:hypothetical protein